MRILVPVLAYLCLLGAPEALLARQVICTRPGGACPPQPDTVVVGLAMDGATGAPLSDVVVHFEGSGVEVITTSNGVIRAPGPDRLRPVVLHHRCYYSVRLDFTPPFGPLNVGLPRRPSVGCGQDWPAVSEPPDPGARWQLHGTVYEATKDSPVAGPSWFMTAGIGSAGAALDDAGRFAFSLPNTSPSVDIRVSGACHAPLTVLAVAPVADGVRLDVRIPWTPDPPATDMSACGSGPEG